MSATTTRSMLGLLALVVTVGAAQQWLANRHADGFGERVAQLARPGDIRMISSQTCGICAQARAWFTRHGVAYSECSIETDAACSKDFELLGAPGTPVIQVRGQSQLGFSPERLQRVLQQTRM